MSIDENYTEIKAVNVISLAMSMLEEKCHIVKNNKR